MRWTSIARVLTIAVLLGSLLVPGPAAATTACDSPAATSGAGLITEAFDMLERLYVEPLPPSPLLAAAADAAYAAVQRTVPAQLLPEPPKTFGDEQAAAATRFTTYYCSLWERPSESAEPTAVAYASIQAMAASVNEAHTRFFTPQMYRAHQSALSGDERYEGIGARLRSNPLAIEYVFPGSPAEAADLRAGDQILTIDGRPVADMTAQDAVTLVRGDVGSIVNLVVRRPSVEGELSFSIARATIRIPTLESRLVDDVAHLHIRSFPSTPLHEEIATELAWFNAAGARALILDLRANSGGRLDIGSRVAGLFLPDGAPIYRQTTRAGRTTTRASSGGPTWTKPLVVLVDGGTASMGEILAAALKEQAGATVIGSTTAGAVAGSIVVPLSDGSALQITTLRIDSSQGTVLNAVGLRPDIVVPTPDPVARTLADPVIDAALTHLRPQPATPIPGRVSRVPADETELLIAA